MPILVTGASGFVGSKLIDALQREGHPVRAFGRDRERVLLALEHPPGAGSASQRRELEVVEGDAVRGTGLDRALEGVEVAYYLIHSMERASQPGSLADRERRAADNFADAAVRGGVKRIVYLGGLLPAWEVGDERAPVRGPARNPARTEVGRAPARGPASRHLASRIEVERVLLGALRGSLALRASIVIGARSRSFRLLVRLVERMRVMALPSWHRFRTQPIDARDVIAMLAAAADPRGPRGALEIAGPDVLTYGDMLRRIAELMLIGRPTVSVGMTMRAFSGRVAAAIAGEDPELVSALMEGLKGDLLADGTRAGKLLGVPLHSFDSAVEHALSEWEATERLAAR